MEKKDAAPFSRPDSKLAQSYPPYYLHLPKANLMQIWVKPRYWFPVLVAILGISWITLIAFEIFDSTIVPNDPVPATGNLHLFFFAVLLISGFLVVAYKRIGLIEISPDGVLVVPNPRLYPENFSRYQLQDISGIEREILYIKFRVAGCRLFLKRRNGASIELIKSWDPEAVEGKSFAELEESIQKVLRHAQKAQRAKRVKAPDDVLRKKVEEGAIRERYLLFEKVFLVLAFLLSCFLIPVQTVTSLPAVNGIKAFILTIFGTLAVFQLAFVRKLPLEKDRRRGIVVLFLLLLFFAGAFLTSWYLRTRELSDTENEYGWVSNAQVKSSGTASVYKNNFYFKKGSIQYNAQLETTYKLVPERPIIVRLSKKWPRIYEVNMAATEKIHRMKLPAPVKKKRNK